MKSFLFVGAPFGPFFKSLAGQLERRGAVAWRIVSHGGEIFDTPRRSRIAFRGEADRWPAFVEDILTKRKIDAVVTFNDTLPRNRAALDAAERLRLHSFVLENGYLRPYWVTLERDGVNGFSRLPRDPSIYLDSRYLDEPAAPHERFVARLRPHVLNTIRHFLAAVVAAPVVGFDASYYGDSVFRQMSGYVSEYAWRVTHDETRKFDAIADLARAGRKLFLCLMQKPGDGQLVIHSRHGGNEAFLAEVLTSFSKQAPGEAILVIKQHPLDYGIEQSQLFVDRLVEKLGLTNRVFYLRKTSIDRVMPLAFGVLTINSTAGLASLMEEKPVICLGRSFYDIAGLTFQGALDVFWREAKSPDPALARGFINFLKATSQINGGFHTKKALRLLTPQLADRLTQSVTPVFSHNFNDLKQLSYAERHLQPQVASLRIAAVASHGSRFAEDFD